MEIVYQEEDLRRYIRTAVEASPERPVLVDRFLEDATEVDVDCISDGETSVIGCFLKEEQTAHRTIIFPLMKFPLRGLPRISRQREAEMICHAWCEMV